MITHTEKAIDSRILISSLWVSMLLVFAYVDIFGLMRADVLEAALAGKVFVFDASQMFFLLTTLYIALPCLMVPLSLLLPTKLNKLVNTILPILYIVTIAGGVVGEEWLYYIFGSLIEVVLLATIVLYARKLPTQTVATETLVE